jgi:hypothetical protein
MNNFNNVLISILISILIGYYSSTGIKSQLVRLVDIFIYGPVLIYVGIQLTDNYNRPDMGSLLILFGGTTIGYNLRNYLNNI